MTENETTQTMHLRLDSDLYARVVDYAKRTHRSRNGAVAYLLRQSICDTAAIMHLAATPGLTDNEARSYLVGHALETYESAEQ